MTRNTGIVYDGRMCRHAHPKQMHPEQPLRIERIYKSILKVFGPVQEESASASDIAAATPVASINPLLLKDAPPPLPSSSSSSSSSQRNARIMEEESFSLLQKLQGLDLDDGVNFDNTSDEEDDSDDDGSKEIGDVNINDNAIANADKIGGHLTLEQATRLRYSFPDILRLKNDKAVTALSSVPSCNNNSSNFVLSRALVRIPIRKVSFEELSLVHDKPYLEEVQNYPALDLDELCDIALRFNSIYLCKESLDCAILSCGGVIEAVNHVIHDNVDNAFAIVRPPGHHAESHCAMGFCLFNNVAVAAKVALTQYSSFIKKVLILDWDVHHGNGTQHMFYDNPNVMYVSLHRYDDGGFYPNSKDANYDKIGGKDALGTNINIAWNKSQMGDADYLYAFHRLIMPVASEFKPDLVIVSAGFDAALNDPIGNCCVSPVGYATMTHLLKSLANGKIVIALEGGYNLHSISASAVACVSVLLGHTPPPLAKNEFASLEGIEAVENTLSALSPYWKCLYPKYGPRLYQEMEKLAHFKQNVIPLHDLMPKIYGLLVKDSSNLIPFPVAHDVLKDMYGGRIFTTEDLLTNTNGVLVTLHDMPNFVSENPILSSTIPSSEIYLYESMLRIHKTCKFSRKLAIMDVTTSFTETSMQQLSWEMSGVFQLLQYLKQTCLNHCCGKLIFIATKKNCRILEKMLEREEPDSILRSRISAIIWVPGPEKWSLPGPVIKGSDDPTEADAPVEEKWFLRRSHAILDDKANGGLSDVSYVLASNYQKIMDFIDEYAI